MKLLEGTVDKLVVPAGKRDVQVFDDALPGFGIRKFASGKAFYFCKYNIGPQQRKMSLGPVVPGTLAAKRKIASEILSRARIGQDLAADKRSVRAAAALKERTLVSLLDAYLDDCAERLRSSTYSQTERCLRRHLIKLHSRPVNEINRAEIVQALDELVRVNGPSAADRAKMALSGFFSWAIDRGHLDANPVQNIAARAESHGRSRVLSVSELVEIWRACREDDHGRIVRLLILLGQRKTEIGSLEHSEVDRARQQIELPGERTKNHRPHIVPLSDEALSILDAVPQSVNRTHVFGIGQGGFSGWSKAKDELDERIASARREARLNDDMAPWVLHDVRRSVVTHLHEMSFAQPHVVEAIVNHVSGHKAGVAGVYNKALYLAERREALNQWAAHLALRANSTGAPHAAE